MTSLRLCALAGAVAIMAIPQWSLAIGAPRPSISGTITMSDSPCSMVKAGSALSAGVYVLPLNSKGAVWSAPVLTDSYGRFAFYNLATGSYLLRIMCGNIRVWEQIASVPQDLGIIKVHSTIVAYSETDSLVDQALQAVPSYPTTMDYDYFAEAGVERGRGLSNCLWYGKEVPLADVKAIASALVRGRVPLQAIHPLSGSGSFSSYSRSILNKLVLVGNNPAAREGPLLTLDAISSGRF